MDESAGRVPFHLMAKPTGAVCNLDCEYCFFLSKDQLYPDSTFRMGEDLLEEYLGQLLSAQRGLDEVVVTFQGGEPTLMGLPFFERVLELERELAHPGQRVINALQTNATLIDDEWVELLRRGDFLVGVSIDGPREVHDAFRVDKGGKPTFDRVMRGLDRLRSSGVRWNALTTVNAANMHDGARVYRFLRDDLGADFIQLIPVVERVTPDLLERTASGWGSRAVDHPMYRQQGDQVTHRSVAPAAFGRFLVDVFEEWVRRDVGTVFVQMFDTALAHWLGLRNAGMCVHAETCGTALVVEHNGDVYSCDHYVEPDYRLGSLRDGRPLLELVTSAQQRAFGQAKRADLPRYCLDCDVRFACNGGCPKDRFTQTPDGEPGLHYLCEGYQTFFRHVDEPMRVMADLLRRGQEARGIIDWYAHADALRPRNGPCSCGSGRKWKHCHGAPGTRGPLVGVDAVR